MGWSFCGKDRREVKKLIAGPKVVICDQCIGLCNGLIAEEVTKDQSPGDPEAPPPDLSVRPAVAAAEIHALRDRLSSAIHPRLLGRLDSVMTEVGALSALAPEELVRSRWW